MNDLKKVTELVELQLVGLDGNAFSLIGAFKSAAKEQGTPKAEIDAVIAECTSGDYNHLLYTLTENTFDPFEDEDEYYDDEDEDA